MSDVLQAPMIRPRVDHWDEAMLAEVERHKVESFAWNPSSDCLAMALDCVKAMTGFDPREDMHLSYDSKVEAYEVVKAQGFDSLGEALATHFLEIHPVWAGRGDLALITHDEGITVGVFVGAMIAAKEPAGVAMLPRSRAVKAFRV